MPGYWEFPGGKCEPGETAEQAVVRECREETGLDVLPIRFRDRITHHYPHGLVELSYFDVVTVSQSASPDPSTGFVWVAASELPSLTFPEANAPILDALGREEVADE